MRHIALKEQDLQLRFRPFRIPVYRLRPCIFQRAVAIHRKPEVAEVEGRAIPGSGPCRESFPHHFGFATTRARYRGVLLS